MSDTPRPSDQEQASPGTLGAVLYASLDHGRVPESGWVQLVRNVAAGDVRALRALVEVSYRIVFTLADRITTSRHAAEEVTINVYQDVWRHARKFDPAAATVIAWLMNRTRSRSFERLQRDMQAGRPNPAAGNARPKVLWPDFPPVGRLWWRIEQRLGVKDEIESPPQTWTEPEWEQVAPNISCKPLANDLERHRVSMLVRLAPGGDYPPHKHAGLEELHLLEGELWIEDRKLVPGDYNRAHAGTADKRVWSETGCACVLITSTEDDLS